MPKPKNKTLQLATTCLYLKGLNPTLKAQFRAVLMRRGLSMTKWFNDEMRRIVKADNERRRYNTRLICNEDNRSTTAI